MSADPRDEFRITYMNAETRRLLDRIAHLLPVPPGKLLGESIDILHRNPSHQRAILADPARLPHTARIRLGEDVLEWQSDWVEAWLEMVKGVTGSVERRTMGG